MQLGDYAMHRAEVRFERPRIADIPGEIKKELEGLGVRIPQGGRIAVTIGSRGIANIALIAKSVCDYIKEKGAHPFIIPAMGSHGGATAEGQREMIEGFGVREEYVGAPILSSMEVVEIDSTGLPNRVYMDKNAWESDGVILIGRVKPHTDFSGEIESGLCKMSVVGMGKHKQALEIHSFGVYGLIHYIEPSAKRVFEQNKVLLGLAVLENAYDETALLRAVRPENMPEMDRSLLSAARRMLPALPATNLDILIVDRIGKDISGTCFDTNIIGRRRIDGLIDPEYPKITYIVAESLTEESHGNATGVGLADFITRRLFERIDFRATNENVLTSSFVHRGKIPMIAEDTREAVSWCFRAQGRLTLPEARIIRIKSTLELSEILVSEPIARELEGNANITLDETPRRLFAGDGFLAEF